MTGLTAALAAFSTGPVAPGALAAEVARLSALDWVAVGLAGRDEPVAQILRAQALADGGAAHAHLFGGGKVPARAAALVNGTVSHALDYDDTHFAHIGHPSVAVFPAALAIGEETGASLGAMIEAALVGMEVSVRVGIWMGRGHYQTGFHQTATAGSFGAVAAAGRLAGLDAAAMATALGLAATQAAGLKVQFGTMGKPYNAGLAASTGVQVVQLAARGFEARADAIEAPFGFGATHHGAAEAGALDGLGTTWHMEGVSHKFHACCHGLHAALEAMATLDLAAPEIAGIRVATHPRWMSVCNQPAPMTGLGAKFSYGTVLAMRALGLDTAQLGVYSDATCARADLTDLRARVSVEADDTLTEMQARLEVTRKDGQHVVAFHDLDAPLAIEMRRDKVVAKAQALIGPEAVERVQALLSRNAPAAALGAFIAG